MLPDDLEVMKQTKPFFGQNAWLGGARQASSSRMSSAHKARRGKRAVMAIHFSDGVSGVVACSVPGVLVPRELGAGALPAGLLENAATLGRRAWRRPCRGTISLLRGALRPRYKPGQARSLSPNRAHVSFF